MIQRLAAILLLVGSLGYTESYAFVARKPFPTHITGSSSSSLKMLDDQIIMGGGVAFAGLAVGIGMVAFTENQGERARERGSGLSDGMSTRIAGGLLEDVELDSVDDLGSLTSQLEMALKEKEGVTDSELTMTEEEKERIAQEADDGW